MFAICRINTFVFINKTYQKTTATAVVFLLVEARRQCALLRRIVLPTQYAPLLFAYSVPESTYTRYKTIHRIVLLTLVPFGVRFSLIFRNKKPRQQPWSFCWWRRGESNSCPKTHPTEALRVQSAINIPSHTSSQTNLYAW